MMLAGTTFASYLSWALLGAVGIVYLWTGVIKALAPVTFRQHPRSLGWVPANLLSSTVIAAAGFEAAWGTAILLELAPSLVLPGSVFVLIALSAISWRGVSSGNAADCGCYGGFIQPSINRSLALNGAFATALIFAWYIGPDTAGADGWKVGAVAIAALIVGGVAAWGQHHELTTGEPKFLRNPLVEGEEWKHSWSRGATRDMESEVLVAFLGPDCPFCKQWVKIGNAVIQSPDLPKVIGVVGAPQKRKDEFVKEYGIRFPVVAISPSLMSRLAPAVPTTVLVDGGSIKNKWVGAMPPEFAARFRRAFFPSVEPAVPDQPRSPYAGA